MTMIQLDEDAVVVLEPVGFDPRWVGAVVDDGYVVDWQMEADDGGSILMAAEPSW